MFWIFVILSTMGFSLFSLGKYALLIKIISILGKVFIAMTSFILLWFLFRKIFKIYTIKRNHL
jgi:hypothetical protein